MQLAKFSFKRVLDLEYKIVPELLVQRLKATNISWKLRQKSAHSADITIFAA